jgi:uncharacterized membrane protein (UPF0136 family)
MAPDDRRSRHVLGNDRAGLTATVSGPAVRAAAQVPVVTHSAVRTIANLFATPASAYGNSIEMEVSTGATTALLGAGRLRTCPRRHQVP